ncbi:MAG: acetyltransferase [Candidatus Omnitrophota bacterium]
MKLPVIVLGAGGHARVLLDVLRLCKVKVLGVTDAQPSHVDKRKLQTPVLGTDKAVLAYSPKKVLLVNGLGSVSVTPKRAEIFKYFKDLGYHFAKAIHPSAIVAKDVQLGEGVQVMAGSVIQTGCKIGNNTIINTRVSIDHDCNIGSHVHIAPGAVLSGGISIGEGCHLGPCSVVIQGISIAPRSFIRAQLLVHRRVKS